ncbi:hypothetical protein GO755_11455 [Spirosoma sp. HMF4905]|uniref:LTD domain-containing protein n=2 Tax=Spirosoma arboris TaxID=2682092 RepID=A0A7K1SAF7_9BACT|nr:hypothetical protein [Spirosoma arboris]
MAWAGNNKNPGRYSATSGSSAKVFTTHVASKGNLAPTVSANIVISQVYGGGGNAGATYKNDFIELFNRGNTPVNIDGWSVQYASSSGTSWQVTNLSGTIQPGRYYLVQESIGSGGTVNLPTPDAIGTIALSGTAGKVALVSVPTALSGSCAAGANVVDFVGFGTANCFEGSGPTPAPSNTTAILRGSNGCTETDNNSSDFATGAPNPRNISASANLCNPTGPALSVLPTTKSGIYYIVDNGPSSPVSFTVTGSNLTPTTSVTVVPPANFDISTDGTTYANSPIEVLPLGDGTVNKTIYAHLTAGLSTSTYSGSVTVSSSEVTGAKTVALSGAVYPAGSVGPCGTSIPIGAVRAGTDGTVYTVTGRVISNIGTNIYIQDATGGILLYTGTGTTTPIPELTIGDEIQVTGTLSTYNTDKELGTFTGCFVNTGAANVIPTSTTVTTATLCDHKGELVTLPGVTIASSATAFAGNTNYTLSDGTVIRIQNGTNLVTASKPTGTIDITGVVSLFNNVCQLLPRSTDDVPGSTPTAAACPEVGTGGSGTAVTGTLDIVWWNVEWLGNTGFGPTNEAQQQSNVATQLQTMNKDIYCLEEICDLTKLDAIVATLSTNTGKSYTYTCGADPTRTPAIYYSHWFDDPEVTGDATTYAQKVCFVYDKAIVTNVSASQILTGTAGSSDWASNRFPLLMNCDVTINGIKKNLKLVGLHAKSGSDVSSYNRRIADFNSLKTYLDATYPNDNVLIMGDYNDDADQSIYIDGTTTFVSSFSAFTTSPDYTVITKQLSNCNVPSTASYPDIIDHLTVSNEISTNGTFTASGIQYITNSVNNVRPVTGGTTTSDHYPVTARFLFAAPDLTPTIDLPQANFSDNATNTFLVTITEVGNMLSATGNTVITITAPVGYTLAYDNTLTTINVTDGEANPVTVDNTKWSVTNNLSDKQLTLTAVGGQPIAASGKSVLGLSITRTSANAGSASNVMVNITDDASQLYDSNSTNNVYSRVISGL